MLVGSLLRERDAWSSNKDRVGEGRYQDCAPIDVNERQTILFLGAGWRSEMLINLQFEMYAHDVVVPDLVVESARGSDGGGHGELAGQVGRRNERRRETNLIHFSLNTPTLISAPSAHYPTQVIFGRSLPSTQ